MTTTETIDLDQGAPADAGNLDQELEAMSQLAALLGPLPAESRLRAVDWAIDRFNITRKGGQYRT